MDRIFRQSQAGGWDVLECSDSSCSLIVYFTLLLQPPFFHIEVLILPSSHAASLDFWDLVEAAECGGGVNDVR